MKKDLLPSSSKTKGGSGCQRRNSMLSFLWQATHLVTSLVMMMMMIVIGLLVMIVMISVVMVWIWIEIETPWQQSDQRCDWENE